MKLTDRHLQMVFALICPLLVLPAFWMLPVDMDSLPASQSAALEQMAQAKVEGTLISSKQLAQRIGKSQQTTFGALVEVWTAEAAWKPMSQCLDLLGALQDAMHGITGSLAALVTPAAAPDRHAAHASPSQLAGEPQPIQPAAIMHRGPPPPSLHARLVHILSTADVLASMLASVSLGAGGFGAVYQCKLDGMDVALKFPQRYADNLLPELVNAAYSKLHHENIVRLVGFGSLDPSRL